LKAVGLWTVHYAPGMRGVVMFGGEPACVDARVIARLQTRLADVEVVDALGEALNPGDHVVITQGPFAEFDAVFDKRLSADGRVRVLIEFLQRSTPVEIEARALRKTSQFPRRERIV
jgi:transcription antitermination factor NusG